MSVSTKNKEIAPLQYSEKDMGALGPKMLALNPRQRAFVIAMIETGQDNHTRCARMAGYYNGNDNALRVTAFRLAHDDKIQAAIVEQAGRRMKAGTIMATSALLSIASNQMHKDQLRAAVEILNRTGLHAVSETKITHEHIMDDKQSIQRVVELARSLKIDPRQLLGQYGVTLDAEFEEVAERKEDTATAKMIEHLSGADFDEEDEEDEEQEPDTSTEGLEDLL